MEITSIIPLLLYIIVALIILFRLTHYARFYGPSYFFWTGIVIILTGLISLIHPLSFLFIFNRFIAFCVIFGGALISVISLLAPVKVRHSPTTELKTDELLPFYSLSEFHSVKIKKSVEQVKHAFQNTGVKDIRAAYLLMKIRGIAGNKKESGNWAAMNNPGSETISTPDFNFFVAGPDEYITLMIIKSSVISNKSKKTSMPEISSVDQFIAFNNPGFVKVVLNFRFISINKDETLLTTETRVHGISPRDSRIFSRYWRVIYPGSAIIRRVWLDTIKRMTTSDKTEYSK